MIFLFGMKTHASQINILIKPKKNLLNTFNKFQRKTFPQFKVKELAIFPITNANQAEQEKIAKKAQTMLDLNKKLQATSANTDKHNSLKREIEKLDCEIDETIYKLYRLTNEEIRTIENN